MPPAEGTFPIIAHAIQLAIAPVFLVTGIAAMLGVMANRLARVIDRARDLEQRWPNLDAAMRADVRIELQALEKRRHFASWSINFCTGAALLVCLVIGVQTLMDLEVPIDAAKNASSILKLLQPHGTERTA